MKVAIDRKIYKKIKDFNEFDYVYVFDDEPIEKLLKLNLHCIHKDFVDKIDVNLTDYEINCFRKAKWEDDWKDTPEKNYKFSIIVPNCNNDHGNYNGKTFFQNCIESVLNQTYKNYELIIVDDCSTDTSVETVEKYVDNRIHLIKNDRKRYNGGSRNVGIDYALNNFDFDYFCFLDSDDWWIDNNVLSEINEQLCGHHLLIIGAEMLFKDMEYKTFNEFDNYKEFFISDGQDGKIWCTAWCRVIRKDKIVHFCEDTLMEDRVWSYRQADNVDFDKVKNYKKVCYVWNRLNTSNSVSIKRNDFWNASAWCHIGHCKQFLTQLKHKEMEPIIEKRIECCIKELKKGQYKQY